MEQENLESLNHTESLQELMIDDELGVLSKHECMSPGFI